MKRGWSALRWSVRGRQPRAARADRGRRGARRAPPRAAALRSPAAPHRKALRCPPC